MSRHETRPTFGALLRGARLAAGLTQAELAARSGLSARGLSDLERGTRRAPRRETLECLMRVLCLTDSERVVWEQARLAGSVRPSSTRRRRQTAPLDSSTPAPGSISQFIGRSTELRIVLPLIEALQAGTGGAVVIAGDPGIGKTRFAHELASVAASNGAGVLWGHCSEIDGTPPYWPWIQLIRAWLEDRDDGDIEQDLGSAAPVIGQLVPEIRQRLPDLPEPQPTSPDQARFRIFDSITAWLQRTSARRPLVIIVDDLHWADSVSLQLLQFVAPRLHEMSLLVVATYRDAEIHARHSLPEALDALNRQLAHVSVRLDGLDEADVAGVIEQIAGTSPQQPLAEAILQRTDGNPFFVIEIVRHLATGGLRQAIDPNKPLVIPGNVRDAIRRRVSAISSNCRDLLETAAVIGRDFSAPVLAAASGRSIDDVIDLLDEASRAHITHETDAAGQSRFTHVLISETLAADLGTRRRMKQHASIAAAFERVHAAETPSYIDVIAHHYRMAAAIGFARQAIDSSVAAAQRAMGQAAWEKAIDHYQQALDVFELLPRPDLTERCTLLLALGDSQNVEAGLFDSAAARATFEQAADLAFEVSDAELLAQAAIGFGGINALTTTGGVRQVTLLDEALSMLGPSDSALKARVLGRLAASLMDRSLSRRDVPRARTLSDSSLAMARRIGDPIALVYALLMWHIAHRGPADTEERLAAMQEAISVAEAAGERELVALAHELRCNDLLEMGAITEFEHSLQVLHGLADELRLPLLQWSMLNRQAVRAQSAGHYERAESLVRELRDARSLVGDRVSFLKLFFLLREQGRLDEIADEIRATLASSGQLYDLAFGLILDIDTGHLDEARLALEQIPVDSYGRLEHDATWLMTLALHAEACHALDDGDRAGVLFTLLSPYAERNVSATGNLFLGAVTRFLGLLATTRHEWEVAGRQFRHAIAVNTRLAMPAYVAHARYAYAEMLTRRGVPADHETVRALLDPVITTTRTLGMRPLHERASALLESSTHLRSGAVVSSREHEVLCLIAEGRSNLEIAAALSISPHTVETHVTNILNKLGVESRTAAATWAVRRGIV